MRYVGEIGKSAFTSALTFISSNGEKHGKRLKSGASLFSAREAEVRRGETGRLAVTPQAYLCLDPVKDADQKCRRSPGT